MKEIIVNVDNYNENSIKTIEGDNLSEVYKIYICKNKRRIDLTNKIAIMAYVNEYGNKKSDILALNITNASQGEIELPITNVISSENGVYACQIAIYGENNSLEQTAPFSLIVENNIFSKISNTAINSSDFHILSEAIKTANEYSDKLKEGTENIELKYANKLNEIKAETIKIADINNNLIKNGTNIENLKFELKKIDNRKFLTLEKYSTNFENPSDDKTILTPINNPIYNIEPGKLIFKENKEKPYEAILKSPFKFEAGAYYVKCRVEQDKSKNWFQIPRIGICKDNNNWIMGNVDKNNSKASFVVCNNGYINEFGAKSIERDLLVAPYNLIMLVNGFTAYLIYEKNNEYKTLSNWTQTDTFNFSGENNLNEYTAAIGARLNNGDGDLIINEFEFGYTNGMSMGADFKPLTYEDGSLIQEDNCIYFTASAHSTEELNGTGGANIYKINLLNYEVEFTGRIFQKMNNNIYGGASFKVFFDRNKNEWVVTASNFDFEQLKINIGFTKSNLKNGIHVIDMRSLSLAGDCWDNDIIYKDGKYLMTYNLSAGAIYLAESTDLINWRTIINKTITGEGNVFTKVNGKYYILRAETTNELSVFDLNLNKVGILKTNIWSKLDNVSTPTWGFLCAFNNYGVTNYFLINFSMSLWENRHYTYGNVWVYKALQEVEGVEYKNNFIGKINS